MIFRPQDKNPGQAKVEKFKKIAQAYEVTIACFRPIIESILLSHYKPDIYS